jgi:hypothetical protein
MRDAGCVSVLGGTSCAKNLRKLDLQSAAYEACSCARGRRWVALK